MERRLAVILAADVVGYSRLMEQDEAGTFERLKACRKDLIEPEVERHHGRIFKLMGDGLLAEFGSVVDAVECAVSLQQGMLERNASVQEDQLINLRIGINLGEVIVEGEDRYGEGVNIAARLQQLADPGGIYVSGKVAKEVERKLAYSFEAMGEQKVKNIDRPIEIYRLLMNTTAVGSTGVIRKQRRNWQWPALVVGVLLLIVAAGAASWLRPWEPKIEAASINRMALPLPDKPSIAVLPFVNMSSNEGRDNFADGMTDDLITDLSKISGLFVIARNSTFVYKGKAVKISQVAEDLGVRYVLEGSVRRAGDTIRVNAQLIDALTGGHVWADRFDGSVSDIFAAQDEFLRKIVGALEVNLTKREKEEITRAKTDNIAAKVAFDEGWNLYQRFNAKDNAAAVGPLQRAINLDPEYGRAYAALAIVYIRAADYGWLNETRIEGSFQSKLQHLMEQSKKYPVALSYAVEAYDYLYLGRLEHALIAAEQAIALDPNDPEAHILKALALTTSGKPMEALNFVAKAIRLNPTYPSHYVLVKGVALFAAGDLEQAAKILDEGFKQNPQAVALLPLLSSVLAQLGRREEARQTLLKWQPKVNQSALERFAAAYPFPYNWKPEHIRVRERLLDGIRLAALPPDTTVSSLVAELRTDDPFGRWIALQRLGWFGSGAVTAVPVLVRLLGEDIVRKEVVQTLRKIGPEAKAAIPALVNMQNEIVIGSYAKDALKEIRGY